MKAGDMRNSPVAQQWVQLLHEEKDEEPHVSNRQDYLRYTRLPRWWKSVFDLGQLSPTDKILEVGCGSGHQLIPLAAQGFRVMGLDVSPDALERCRKLVTQLQGVGGGSLSVTLASGDFAQMPVSEKFPLVFSFGVIEHFLDRSQRLQFLRRLAKWTAPEGTCVNCVPNGMQPLRQMMRENKLGGYNIPEIDYGIGRLNTEMHEAGFAQSHVVPLDLFGYRLVLTRRNSLPWWFFRSVNLFFKVVPHRFLPLAFRERHAYILASVARQRAR